ncbi:MAG: biopolymer transporter ExbD [Myxococcales bacterium]|nr:biopolymer transporter ExbD [Myxococcota bacterium]MDW8282012.1 biopolymer transporter ExbD [Myxococcales bacterium]
MMSSGDSANATPDEVPQLNLVALIDILTNLLFFLLTIFASQHLALEGRTHLTLPESRLGFNLRESIVVSLSKTELAIERSPIAHIEGGRFDVEVQGDQIVPLYNRLTAARASRSERGMSRNHDDSTILLMADKDIPYELLAKVMKTAAMAGYPNFHLVALRK